MKLEKDRLIAKVENLDLSLKQLREEQDEDAGNNTTKGSPAKTQQSVRDVSTSQVAATTSQHSMAKT
mgnify:CR=1 FL=1